MAYMLFRKINHNDSELSGMLGKISETTRNKLLSIDSLFLKIPVNDIVMSSVMTQGVFKIYGQQSINDIICNKNRFTKMNFGIKYYNKLAYKKEDDKIVLDKEKSIIGVDEFEKGMMRFLLNPVSIYMAISSNDDDSATGLTKMHQFKGDIVDFDMSKSARENFVKLNVNMNITYFGKLSYVEFFDFFEQK